MSAFGLRSRQAVLPDGPTDALVVVRDQRIAAVLPPDARPGVPVRDLGSLALLPGLVDAHVHLNEPGRTEWEGFATATRAAAAGGVTTLVDMPLNCTPVTTTAAALRRKLAATSGRLWVDCAFWGGVVPGNAPHLGPLVRAGAAGAKAFLIHSGIDDFPASGEADLRQAMAALAREGVPLLVHAELELPVPPSELPVTDYRRFLASRPPAWEVAAIERVIRLCRQTGCRVHIVHLSAADALPALARARAEGLPLTVETCPHYLCLSAEEVPPGATEFKCCPPIREAENRERLWQGLAQGHIDVVVTDHSPCTPHLKLPDRGDFEAAWGGVASLQLGLAAVWTEARRRGLTLHHLARWMAEAPARLAGLDARKGRIAPGLDADLVAFDPGAAFAVDPSRLFHRHPTTPYQGRDLRGRVRATWLGGRQIWHDGHHQGGPQGRPLLNGVPA